MAENNKEHLIGSQQLFGTVLIATFKKNDKKENPYGNLFIDARAEIPACFYQIIGLTKREPFTNIPGTLSLVNWQHKKV